MVSTIRERMGMTAIMPDNKPQQEETQEQTMEQDTTIVRTEPPLCDDNEEDLHCQ